MFCVQLFFKLMVYNLFTFIIISSALSCTANPTECCSEISTNTYCLDEYKHSQNVEMKPKKEGTKTKNRQETKIKTSTRRHRIVKNNSTKNKLRKTSPSKSKPTIKYKKRRKTSSKTSESTSSEKRQVTTEMTTNAAATTTKFVESDSLGLVHDMEPQIDMSRLKLKVDKNGCYVINVHVKRGTTNRVLGIGRKRLYIEVIAPEYEDALNAEISRFLSKLFRVSRRSVKLKRGVGSDIKKFVIPKTAILHNSTLKKMVDMLDLKMKKRAEC